MYSIGQFAKKTGVTIRTLHYYDEIGLLKPAHISEKGQRFYNDDNIQTIQTILVCKYLDYSLDDIKAVLLNKEKSLLQSLMEQREQLVAKRQQLDQMIASMDTAIEIHEKSEHVDPTSLLVVIHSLLTVDEQKSFLRQFLSESLIETLYAHFNDNFVELNRKYIAYSHDLKAAFKESIEDEELKERVLRFINILPPNIANEIFIELQGKDIEQFDDNWLFTSLFTAEEEAWLEEQIIRFHLREEFYNE